MTVLHRDYFHLFRFHLQVAETEHSGHNYIVTTAADRQRVRTLNRKLRTVQRLRCWKVKVDATPHHMYLTHLQVQPMETRKEGGLLLQISIRTRFFFCAWKANKSVLGRMCMKKDVSRGKWNTKSELDISVSCVRSVVIILFVQLLSFCSVLKELVCNSRH